MRTAILLALAAPLVVCSDANVSRTGVFNAALAAGVPLGADSGHPQDTTQLVVRRVWTGPGVDRLGTPTPDGKYLTFTDWSSGDLAVRDMRTGEVRHLTDQRGTEASYPELSVVSPDGKRVAYSWYKGDWTFELRIVNLDGTGLTIPFHHEKDEVYASPYAWSPNGREILVGLSRGAQRGIAVVSVDDGSYRILKELVHFPVEASFSPDGRYVVYDRQVDPDSGQRDIFLVPIEGGGETHLVEHPADDFLLGWVPKTDYILFSSDRMGTPSAWVLKVANGKAAGDPILVKPDLWHAYPMGFTADGDFYYGIRVGSRSVYTATLDLESGELLSPPTQVDPRQTGAAFLPTWSPDGRYLSWLKRDESAARRTIIVRSMQTGESREIRPRHVRVSAPRWSPDGRRWLVTGADRDARNRLDLIDVRTTETKPLREFGGDTVCCNWYDWSPDGKTIYYKADYYTQSWLAAMDVETGNERILYKVKQPLFITGVWSDVSPDGKDLVFWCYKIDDRTGRLLVIPTSTAAGVAEPRELLTFRAEANPPYADAKYTPDGRYILVIHRESDPTVGRIWRIPVAGGEPEPLGLARRGLGTLPDIHPDGRALAWAEGQGHTEIWVMEHYLPRK